MSVVMATLLDALCIFDAVDETNDDIEQVTPVPWQAGRATMPASGRPH